VETPDKSRQTKQRKKVASSRGLIPQQELGSLRVDAPKEIEVIDRELMDGAKDSLAYLRGVVKDKKAKPHLRQDAAKDLLNRAGFNTPKPRAGRNSGPEDLASLSPEQLRRFVEAATLQLSEKARLIDSAPIARPIDSQAIDPLG
jgi:hypothetical protein